MMPIQQQAISESVLLRRKGWHCVSKTIGGVRMRKWVAPEGNRMMSREQAIAEVQQRRSRGVHR